MNYRKRESKSGTDIRSGRIYEEYLGALQFPYNSYPVYDKMRRSDYQISRMLRVLHSPILGASFYYTPEDEDDEDQIKQATIKNKMIKEWPDRKWPQILYELLSYLTFGFAIFEPYAKIINDPEFGRVITLRNLGKVKQGTVREWDIKDGVVNRFRQVTTGTNPVDIWVDGSEVIVLTNMQEGDDFEGISLLRPIYGNWLRKDLYLKLDMIGIEKMSVGVPIFYLPKSMINDEKEIAKVEAIGEGYAAHEKQFLILDEALKGGGFEVTKGEYDASSVDTAIKREDMAILDSVLASFLNIGTMRAGGNAQNEGQMQLFFNSLIYVAEYVASVLDTKVVAPMYELNFGRPKEVLSLKVKGIGKDDARIAMEIIRGYVTANVIRADDRLEAKTRENLGLPEADPTTARIDAAPADPSGLPADPNQTPPDQAEPQKEPDVTPPSKGK